ncbi:hypothetical protein EBZ80_11635 [bacterium]|nr:hypothetical protein [bacterium]
MIQTLFKSLRGTDWEILTGFVSPAFFDVVPTVGMARVVGKLLNDYANPAEFEKALKKARKVVPRLSAAECDDPKARGRAVLELYFRQVFDFDAAVLDLRASAFEFKAGKVTWSPKPIFYEWDKDFVAALRLVYGGFYGGDDEKFLAGLAALDLEHAKGSFKAHFGSGDQSAVTFSLATFKKSFHGIFESCKKNKTRLHPDFLALGAYLLCLYEHLEALDVPLDVRGAFDAATRD